jgi:hypothetical protein
MPSAAAKVKVSHLPTSARDGDDDFSFLPKALIEKCRPFILRYHDLCGYTCLADILWHPQTRIFIECNAKLRLLFKKASISRSATQAKESLVFIATVILATEILACGFAGWASLYPHARKKARDLLGEHGANSRARLIERYLYPQIDESRSIAGALAPPAPAVLPGSYASDTENVPRSREERAGMPA